MHYLAGHDRSLMVLLLVAYMLRGCSPDDSATPPAATDAATDTAAATDSKTAAAATGADKPTAGSIGSALGDCASELVQFGSEMATATGEALKAIGRATLATFGLLVSMWNTVSQTTAKAGETVATGYQMANRLASKVPVIGTVTTGGENLLTGSTASFNDISVYNSDRRVKLVTDLRTKLDGFNPNAKSAAAGADDANAPAPVANASPATPADAAPAAAA